MRLPRLGVAADRGVRTPTSDHDLNTAAASPLAHRVARLLPEESGRVLFAALAVEAGRAAIAAKDVSGLTDQARDPLRRLSDNMTVTTKIHFSMANKGRREVKPGPAPVLDTPEGRMPRISRLMALAIKFDQMIADGAVRDQAELAELGHVTRARVTQIMNLLHLAPDIQEQILHLPRVTGGRDPIRERHLRSICAEANWAKQREAWSQLAVIPTG